MNNLRAIIEFKKVFQLTGVDENTQREINYFILIYNYYQ